MLSRRSGRSSALRSCVAPRVRPERLSQRSKIASSTTIAPGAEARLAPDQFTRTLAFAAATGQAAKRLLVEEGERGPTVTGQCTRPGGGSDVAALAIGSGTKGPLC